MVKSALSVLLGWAVVGVLVVATDFVLMKVFPNDYVAGRMPPDSLAAVSLATSTLWSVIGGWVSARLAPRKAWHHVLGLVLWGEVMGLASAVMTWGKIQSWYQIGLLLLWVPAVCLGGWLRLGRPGSRPGSAS